MAAMALTLTRHGRQQRAHGRHVWRPGHTVCAPTASAATAATPAATRCRRQAGVSSCSGTISRPRAPVPTPGTTSLATAADTTPRVIVLNGPVAGAASAAALAPGTLCLLLAVQSKRDGHTPASSPARFHGRAGVSAVGTHRPRNRRDRSCRADRTSLGSRCRSHPAGTGIGVAVPRHGVFV